MGAYVINDLYTLVDGLDPALIISAVATIIALASLLVSRYTANRDAAIQSQDLLLKFDEALRAWGKEAIEAIVALEAAAYQADDPAFTRAIASVSGIIDQGRMLLPNDPRNDVSDALKHEAYQGYRPPVINNLFRIYDYGAELTTEQMGPDAAKRIFELRRRFVAELVIALDTKRKRAVFKKLDSTVRSQFSAVAKRPRL